MNINDYECLLKLAEKYGMNLLKYLAEAFEDVEKEEGKKNERE